MPQLGVRHRIEARLDLDSTVHLMQEISLPIPKMAASCSVASCTR
jgi:hypothetical protein